MEIHYTIIFIEFPNVDIILRHQNITHNIILYRHMHILIIIYTHINIICFILYMSIHLLLKKKSHIYILKRYCSPFKK